MSSCNISRKTPRSPRSLAFRFDPVVKIFEPDLAVFRAVEFAADYIAVGGSLAGGIDVELCRTPRGHFNA